MIAGVTDGVDALMDDRYTADTLVQTGSNSRADLYFQAVVALKVQFAANAEQVRGWTRDMQQW